MSDEWETLVFMGSDCTIRASVRAESVEEAEVGTRFFVQLDGGMERVFMAMQKNIFGLICWEAFNENVMH